MFNVYIGYDSREPIAYQVASKSIENRLSPESRKLVRIFPLKQKEMRELGIYNRPVDKLASTEFTFSRFWVPYLMEYKGYGLFIDCDFLINCDIMEVFESALEEFRKNPDLAIACTKHNYTPRVGLKMDQKQQHYYPRKNWASTMVFNNSHEILKRKLTLSELNNPEYSGKYFLAFHFLSDTNHNFDYEKNYAESERRLGCLPLDFNWLSGEYEKGEHLAKNHVMPRIIHYTLGGPWFKDERCWNYPYADLWLIEVEKIIGRKWTLKDTVDYDS